MDILSQEWEGGLGTSTGAQPAKETDPITALMKKLAEAAGIAEETEESLLTGLGKSTSPSSGRIPLISE
jgi:hypothetical protein